MHELDLLIQIRKEDEHFKEGGIYPPTLKEVTNKYLNFDITLNQEINELIADLENLSKNKILSFGEARSLRILKEIKKNGK